MKRIKLNLLSILLVAAAAGVYFFEIEHSVAQQGRERALREELHAELRQGHRAIGYDATWRALEYLYEDPENSQNIVLFYTGRSQSKRLKVGQDAQNGWNREHLWPRSRGARPEPPNSDLHHLKPSDASVNAARSSLDFDEGGRPQGEAAGAFLDEDSFEPPDRVKGDVARAAFYVDVRYEGGRVPQLRLTDHVLPDGRDVLGDLCTLLAWHEMDPVNTAERRLNDEIERIQGNRNIFVDQPELAAALYGSRC